jgi:ribosomal protein S18 acetylase RimI-like enzyme
MSVEIVEMTVADYDEAWALWSAAEGIGLHPQDVDSRQGISAYLERNPGMSFVARDAGRLVGVVLCGTDGRRGYLSHLVVAANHRQRGLGGRLVHRCLAKLKEMGITRCNLFVFDRNTSAQAFWKKMGWKFYDEFGVKAMSRDVE